MTKYLQMCIICDYITCEVMSDLLDLQILFLITDI